MYTWWQNPPQTADRKLLLLLRELQLQGAIRPSAVALIASESSFPPDRTSWRQLRSIASWSQSVDFDEEASCLQRHRRKLCERAEGSFRLFSIPIARVNTSQAHPRMLTRPALERLVSAQRAAQLAGLNAGSAIAVPVQAAAQHKLDAKILLDAEESQRLHQRRKIKRIYGGGWMHTEWTTRAFAALNVPAGLFAHVINVVNGKGLQIELCALRSRQPPCSVLDGIEYTEAEEMGAPAFAGLRIQRESDQHDPRACDEAHEFQRRCSSQARSLKEHLRYTEFKRGLAIEFVDRFGRPSSWGLGHVLPVVYRMHDWCVQLRRFCYIRMWDMDLDRLFTYHTGQSWGFDEKGLSRYPGTHANLTTDMGNLEMLFDRISQVNSSTSLIRVRHIAPGGGWFHSADWLQRLDSSRCQTHFVMRPAFHHPFTQHGSGAPTHGFHFRTGFADVGDQFIAGHKRSEAATRKWVETAQCQTALFEKLGRRALSVSDSRGLSRWLSKTYQTQHVDHRSVPTRSWNTSFESKLAAAIDLHTAGLTRVLYVDRTSHFPAPVLARSMCVQEVRSLLEVCPDIERILPRDLAFYMFSTNKITSVGRTMEKVWKVHAVPWCGKLSCQRRFQLLNITTTMSDHPCFLPGNYSVSYQMNACKRHFLEAFSPDPGILGQ